MGRKARKLRKQKRKESGYSGDGYSQMNGNKKKMKCECDWEVYTGIASLMLFSRERFEKNPCLMRFMDIILWTVICLIATCVAIQFTPFGRLDTVCNEFLQFQNDCLPLEVVIAVTVLIILLLIIYLLSPSIFNMVSSLDQDIFGRRQKLLNGSDNMM